MRRARGSRSRSLADPGRSARGLRTGCGAEKAIELRDLSREGLAKGFENLKSVDTGGLRKALSYGATCQEKVGVTGSTIWKIDTTQPIALATVADVDSKLAKDYKYCP